MGTREDPAKRGRKRGSDLQAGLLRELRNARMAADVSQRAVATRLGWSQTEYWRFENGHAGNIGLPDIAAASALLGLDLAAHLYPQGDALTDRGQQAVIARLRSLIAAPPYEISTEALLPGRGELRAWDLLLRLDDHLVGIEVETRIRDIQALVRRIRGRERDGGVDAIVIVLADTRTNRDLVGQLRKALGEAYSTSPGTIMAALQAGVPVPGSGVVLV